ncbi:alpha/beta hydrolase fold domain-containing protein [Novosphingobium sp. RL4]|uniref:alpha/beta hydrolase fold domain-containing protein n=1 Tax=Novosphingobium sp. RL4 TaxID=3109595 RepID=UPI002D768545|nr:alpha/beta hydrolase fold domain-containing protein [Novosphingobium sp. RL4]WRT94435.1 alpha/beta hydrolase fold domain-containing protein [Novosphingobium sp. RL4]
MTPLDPQLAEIAEAAAKAGPSLLTMDVSEARAIFSNIASHSPRFEFAGMQVDDRLIAGSGGDLAVRIYRPAEIAGQATTVFLHGGGYILGGLDEMDNEARFLAEQSSSVVVSVDYRLAPEHRLPAAHSDAVTAVQWARAHAEELGGSAACVALAGESAGANLAASAAVSLKVLGVNLSGLLLIVPAPDLAALAALPCVTGDYPMLSTHDLHAILGKALPAEVGAAERFPISAARAANLASMPPTVIGLAGHCPTLQIGEAFAERLVDAGNVVKVHRFANLFHPFFAFAAISEAARDASAQLIVDFRRVASEHRICRT